MRLELVVEHGVRTLAVALACALFGGGQLLAVESPSGRTIAFAVVGTLAALPLLVLAVTSAAVRPAAVVSRCLRHIGAIGVRAGSGWQR